MNHPALKEIEKIANVMEERLHDLLEVKDKTAEAHSTMALLLVAARLTARRAKLNNHGKLGLLQGVELCTALYTANAMIEYEKMEKPNA